MARSLALAGGLLALILSPTPPMAQNRPQPPAAPVNVLAGAKSWGYQLAGVDPGEIAGSPYDVVVVDYSRDGSEQRAFTPGEVARMKVKPDGGRRAVLCYLSIGEAEDYRYYWGKRWSWMSWGGWRWFWQLFGDRFVPSWLGPHNASWKGNYGVRYWQPAWQDLLLSGDNAYLQRIVRAGFDGVYLDKIDEFADMAKENSRSRPDMIALVVRLAKVGRTLSPGFLIVPQNGEELLRDAGYRAAIDGLGKEDFLFGDPKDFVRNAPDVIARNARDLQLLLGDSKPVLAVEYLRDATLIAATRTELLGYGLIPHFADRPLDKLRIGDLPAPPRNANRR